MAAADAGALEPYRQALAEIARAPEPRAKLLTSLPPARTLAVMPGAYNPPTLAHLALAEAAKARGADAFLFAVGTVTIDKPESGLRVEERLCLLCELADASRGFGVVALNRGLYAEQAEALRRSLPALEELTFIVGMDKIGQIFDRRYYENFEDSLAALFAGARLAVAGRGSGEREALEAILAREPARRFEQSIDWLELDPRWRNASSTQVRESLARGELPALPPPVERYLRAHPERFRG